MSSARVDSAGVVKILDSRADPEEVVTEADVQEPAKLAKMLARVLITVADLRRSWAPRRIDYEGLSVTSAGNTLRIEHGMGGAVRYWQIGGTTWALLSVNAATTSSTLVLDVIGTYSGTFTLRVEEAGA